MGNIVILQARQLPDLRHKGLRLLGFVSHEHRSWFDCYFEPIKPKKAQRRRVAGGRLAKVRL